MTNKVLFAILISVDIAVIALIPYYLSVTSAFPAGIFLSIISTPSFYAVAILINTTARKTVLPLGNPIWKS